MIHLTPEQHVFVTERHLATLTTLRPDGTPHVPGDNCACHGGTAP